MKIHQIYKDYKIPQSLQEHMLRVAALAQIIVEEWKDLQIDKLSIVQTCLFHDIAKSMTFDLAKQKQFGMLEEDIENLRKHQENLKSKYGKDEHLATVKICEKIGLSKTSVKLVNNLEWSYIPRLINNKNIESLIPIYCDMRIGPKGILSLKDRLDDLKNRVGMDNYQETLENANKVEEIITQNIKTNINSITDNQINLKFKELLNTKV
ncbi:HD domain-containing protein [Candidatus Parcubacteria bacterium]|nr:MAG: HD domain-containing protein [Candidatus Parcubacteria bacterium]